MLFLISCRSDKKSLEPALTGNTWKLMKIKAGKKDEKLINNPKSYTIKFYDDGKFKVKSDCNKCSGVYTVESKFIKLNKMDCSNKLCGNESYDYLYKKFLNESSSFALSKNSLTLESFKGKLLFTEK